MTFEQIIREISAEEFNSINGRGGARNTFRVRAEQLEINTGFIFKCRPHVKCGSILNHCPDALSIRGDRARSKNRHFKFATRHTEEGLVVFRIA